MFLHSSESEGVLIAQMLFRHSQNLHNDMLLCPIVRYVIFECTRKLFNEYFDVYRLCEVALVTEVASRYPNQHDDIRHRAENLYLF